MAFWGHQELQEASAIAGRIIGDGGVAITSNQKAKWLLAVPRHTHMERMPFTYRLGVHGCRAVVNEEKAADLGVACWIKQRRKAKL